MTGKLNNEQAKTESTIFAAIGGCETKDVCAMEDHATVTYRRGERTLTATIQPDGKCHRVAAYDGAWSIVKNSYPHPFGHSEFASFAAWISGALKELSVLIRENGSPQGEQIMRAMRRRRKTFSDTVRAANQREVLVGAARLAIAHCGHPDPAEGCRLAIATLREALEEVEG